MGRGDDFTWMDVVGQWLGLPDEFTDFIEQQMDENQAEQAIEDSIMEMEAMIGNAGQAAIMEEVFAEFPEAAFASLNGGSTISEQLSHIPNIEAVEEIVAEGEAIFFDALES